MSVISINLSYYYKSINMSDVILNNKFANKKLIDSLYGFATDFMIYNLYHVYHIDIIAVYYYVIYRCYKCQWHEWLSPAPGWWMAEKLLDCYFLHLKPLLLYFTLFYFAIKIIFITILKWTAFTLCFSNFSFSTFSQFLFYFYKLIIKLKQYQTIFIDLFKFILLWLSVITLSIYSVFSRLFGFNTPFQEN